MAKKINLAKTVGEILTEARISRQIHLDEAANDLGVPFRYLEALEHDNLKDLPAWSYINNLLKKYCHYLKIDFANCWNQLKNNPDFRGRKKNKEVEKKHLRSWPKLTRKITIWLLIIVILIFWALKVAKIFSPPVLEISYPLDGSLVSEKQITLRGHSAKEVELIVNNKEIFVDDNGNFETIVDLQKGLNLIKITAKKRYSRIQEKEIKLLFKD